MFFIYQNISINLQNSLLKQQILNQIQIRTKDKRMSEYLRSHDLQSRNSKHQFSIISQQNKAKVVSHSKYRNNERAQQQQFQTDKFKFYNQKLGNQIIHMLQAKLRFFKTAQLNYFINRHTQSQNQIQQKIKQLKNKQNKVKQCLNQLSSIKRRWNHNHNHNFTSDNPSLIQINQAIHNATNLLIETLQKRNVGLSSTSNILPEQTKFYNQEPESNAEFQNKMHLYMSPKIYKQNDKQLNVNSTNNATFTFESGKATKRDKSRVKQQISVNEFQGAGQKVYLKQISPIYEKSHYACSQNQHQHQNQNQIQNLNNNSNDKYLTTQKNQKQKLQKYFYSFLICFSAQNRQYSTWLEGLLNLLSFYPEEINEQQFVCNTQSTLDSLIEILKSQYYSELSKIVNDSDDNSDISELKGYHSMYFSDDEIFIKLVVQFLLINAQQIYNRIVSFTANLTQFVDVKSKISQVITGNVYKQQTEDLEKYLPTDRQVETFQKNKVFQHQYFTFNQRQLQNLLHANKKNIVLKKSLFNIFQKSIKKICFNRMRFCRRFQFEAILRIQNIITHSTIYRKTIQSFFEQLKTVLAEQRKNQSLQQQAFQKMMEYKVHKIFFAWKQIKIKKLKLLKTILKKKNKKREKQMFLCLSKWRLNTRRDNLNQKMMNHSNSCNILMGKYASLSCQSSKITNQKDRIRKSTSNLLIKDNQVLANAESQIKSINKTRQQINKSRQQISNSNNKWCKVEKQANRYNDKKINKQYQRKIKERLRVNRQIRIKS